MKNEKIHERTTLALKVSSVKPSGTDKSYDIRMILKAFQFPEA